MKTNLKRSFNKTKPKRHPIVAFTLLYIAYLICYIDRSAINISLSYIGKTFHLSQSTLGIVASAFFLSYALMQIPGGWLADKFGSKLTVVISITMWSIFTILTGLAWSLTSLLIIRFLFGIGEGSYPSSSLKQITEEVPFDKRSQSTSELLSSNYLGMAIAPLIMAPVIAWIGWQGGFHIIGILGLVFVIAYIFLLRPINDKNLNFNGKPRKTKIPWKKVLTNSMIWKFFLVVFGMNIITKGLDTWMPTYLLQTRHIDLAGTGWMVSLPPIAAGIGAALCGLLMSKFFINKEKWFIAFVSVLTTLFMFGMYKATSLFWVITFQVLTYFFNAMAFGGSFAFFANLVTKKAYGASVGIVNFGGQLAGFLAPVIIGDLVQIFSGSYSIAFLFLVFAGALSFIASLTIKTKEVQFHKEKTLNQEKN